jgi:hypothetical protein
MKKNNLVIIFALAFFCISIGSCTKDFTQTIYSGPDIVEFANPATGVLTRTITVPTGTTVLDSVLVQLVAPQRSIPINTTFTVDAASTILPAEFTLLSPSPVVIASSTSSTWVKFRFSKPAARRTLVLNLTGGDNVNASANWKIFTYTIQ